MPSRTGGTVVSTEEDEWWSDKESTTECRTTEEELRSQCLHTQWCTNIIIITIITLMLIITDIQKMLSHPHLSLLPCLEQTLRNQHHLWFLTTTQASPLHLLVFQGRQWTPSFHQSSLVLIDNTLQTTHMATPCLSSGETATPVMLTYHLSVSKSQRRCHLIVSTMPTTSDRAESHPMPLITNTELLTMLTDLPTSRSTRSPSLRLLIMQNQSPQSTLKPHLLFQPLQLLQTRTIEWISAVSSDKLIFFFRPFDSYKFITFNTLLPLLITTTRLEKIWCSSWVFFFSLSSSMLTKFGSGFFFSRFINYYSFLINFGT